MHLKHPAPYSIVHACSLIEKLCVYLAHETIHNCGANIFFTSLSTGCLPITLSYFVATFFSSVSSLVSAYLLYMQFQVHNQICLPCVAGYFIHMLLFLVFTLRWALSDSGGAHTARLQGPQPTTGSKGGSQISEQANRKQKGKSNEHRSDKPTGEKKVKKRK